jgi:hypothetical protein
MLSAPPFKWSGNKPLLILLLVAGLGSCSGPSALERVLRCLVVDSQVWNDIMPGSKPRFHAVMTIKVRNTGPADIVFRPAEGIVRSAKTGEALRRFTLAMDYQDVRTEEARLAPGSEIELRLRTPMGVPPIDAERHPTVVFSAVLTASDGTPLTIESKPLDILVTR